MESLLKNIRPVCQYAERKASEEVENFPKLNNILLLKQKDYQFPYSSIPLKTKLEL